MSDTQPDWLAQMQAEEADLVRKLSAVRGVIAAYRPGDAVVEKSPPAASVAPTKPAKRPSAGFSAYGQEIVDMAVVFVSANNGRPYPTRDLVGVIEATGITVRGTNKANALSSILARSDQLQAEGRRGWVLRQPQADATGEDLITE